MQTGVFGLGRMGANIVRRLIGRGHECVVFNRSRAKAKQLETEGAIAALELAELVDKLAKPRAIWLMLPAGEPTERAIEQLAALLDPCDILVDGGNAHYIDDIRREAELALKEIHYVDVGTSGGVWGLERGFCCMIGGKAEVVSHLDPIFRALAPGDRSEGQATSSSTASQGYLHCGSSGAGHYVKATHNAIEYGIMMAYAEGFNVLKHSRPSHECCSISAVRIARRGRIRV